MRHRSRYGFATCVPTVLDKRRSLPVDAMISDPIYVQANLPPPWIGLLERINISVFLLWVAVLATVLLRGESGRSGQPGAMRWTA